MIAKEIEYQGINGMKKGVYFFHVSEGALIEWELETHEKGGVQGFLAQLDGDPEGHVVLSTFEDIIRRSYGVRAGDEFYQTKEHWNRFRSSQAYQSLLYYLGTNPDGGLAFVAGIFPESFKSDPAAMAKLKEKAEEIRAQTAGLPEATVKDVSVAQQPEPDGLKASIQQRTGLKNPFKGDDQTYLPWALRKPTDKELTEMSHDQLMDVHRRQSSGWTPPEN